MTTRVVNIASGEPYDVYIGRAGHGPDGYYGNPFPLTRDTPTLRRFVLEAFRDHFLDRVANDPTYRARVLALRGKTLGCPGNCAPKPCHGTVIATWIDEQPEGNMANENKPTVKQLRDALAGLPDDAVWWAYEGEVCALIVNHPTVHAVFHNDGDVEINWKEEIL